jgi:hypothetical protein
VYLKDDDESFIDTLTIAAQHLARACPSLRLITFCDATALGGINAQFDPLADDIEYMAPLDERSDELDGKPIRFWLPPPEINVGLERHWRQCTARCQQLERAYEGNEHSDPEYESDYDQYSSDMSDDEEEDTYDGLNEYNPFQ